MDPNSGGWPVNGRNGRWMRQYRGLAQLGIATLAGGGTANVLTVPRLLAQQPVAANGQGVTQPSPNAILGRRVTVSLSRVSLTHAIDSISRATNVFIEYPAPLLAGYTKLVTIDVADTPLGIVLERVLDGTNLHVKTGGHGNLIVEAMAATRADSVPGQGTISGRVIDSATGRGLSSATVKISGTKLSAVTRDSGYFTVANVPSGDHIVSARLFGYRPGSEPVTVTDNQRTNVRIRLGEAHTVLSGVVTTAAGTQQRVQVGNDITVLNVDSIMRIAPVSSVTDMLESRVPGLIVQHTSGVPGAPSRLRLRGIGSINQSSDPILIVDGVRRYADQSGSRSAVAPSFINGANDSVVSASGGGGRVAMGDQQGNTATYAGPSPLDQIDPNSIETIEVFKGPSATAMYGSDAANGVIVITTKHGHAGPPRVGVTANLARTTLPGNWPTNYYRFGHASTFGGTLSSPCTDYDDLGNVCDVTDSIVAFQALNSSKYSPLTGDPGFNRDASLTVSGGSPTLTYSVTGSASGQTGYLHLPEIERERFEQFHGFAAPGWMRNPDQYNTYGVTSQLAGQLGQSATLTFTNSLMRSAQQQSSLESDLAALSSRYVDTTLLGSLPLFTNYYTRVRFNTMTFSSVAALNNWRPVQWSPVFTADAGISKGDMTNTALTPHGYVSCSADNPSGSSSSTCAHDSVGNYALDQRSTVNSNLNVYANFMLRQLVKTTVGINAYAVAQSEITGRDSSLDVGVTTPPYLDNVTTLSSNTATYGWYVEPRLNLSNQFFASPGFRFDGGSGTGQHGGVSGSNLSLFPKLDLSWIAVNRTDERPLFGVISQLRPRLGFGVAGVQPQPDQQLRLLATLNQVSRFTIDPTNPVALYTLGNTTLHPERDQEVEGGVDLDLWNERMTLQVTGYNKLAKDAIMSFTLAPSISAGFIDGNNQGLSQSVNVGDIRNRGVELHGSVSVLETDLLRWSIDGSLSKNSNVLLRLAPGIQTPTLGIGEISLKPGYPVNGLWARPVSGAFDANGDGVIAPNEVRIADSAVYVGSGLPNYQMAFSTQIGFFNNRVTINTEGTYQDGLTQYLPEGTFDQLRYNPTLSAAQKMAFAAGCSGGAGATGTSCTNIGYLQTVSTLRWQTLSIGYMVPDAVARRWFRIPHMSVSLQGSNLGLHTNYRGADPNVNINAFGNATQASSNVLPQPRVWNLHVNLGNL